MDMISLFMDHSRSGAYICLNNLSYDSRGLVFTVVIHCSDVLVLVC